MTIVARTPHSRVFSVHCAGGQAQAPTENLSPPKTDTLPERRAEKGGVNTRHLEPDTGGAGGQC